MPKRRKIFHNIHVWLSLPLGLIISLICLSGALLVFEPEITELCYPQRYQAKKSGQAPLPVAQLLQIARQAVPEDISITGITIPSDAARTYQISLSSPSGTTLYIDPYTGEIKGKAQRSAFFTFMRKIHRRLLDDTPSGEKVPAGKRVVGVSTLLFVFILVSGILIWMPRTRKALKNRLKITVTKGTFRFWHDLHATGGAYATLILLALALTGLTWSFAWYKTAFYALFNAKPGTGHHRTAFTTPAHKKQNGEKTRTAAFIHWQQVYEQLKEQNPHFKQISISDGNAQVTFPHIGNQRAADRYTFHPGSGKITAANLYENQNKTIKTRGWIYSVHVGSWGGITTRILTFIAALSGALLPLTGYYFWIRKQIKKRSIREKPRK